MHSFSLFSKAYNVKQSTFVLVAFAFILIADVIVRLNSFIGISNGSTELVAALNFVSVISLLIVANTHSLKYNIPNSALSIFKLFIIWSTITFFRGAINANDYWDWKILLLYYSFSISVPLALVVGVHFELLVRTFRFILNKLFIFGLALIPITLTTDSELYARIMMAVSLFILFIPYLNYRWRILIIIVAIFSMTSDLSYRVNLLRILFPLSLIGIFFFRRGLSTKFFNFALGAMFLAPLLLLYLGLTNSFNIFTDGISNLFNVQITSVGGGERTISDLSSDTRTFLYDEVFRSMAYKDSSFIFGEGAASGYQTIFFDSSAVNSRGRYSSEVGFLNMVHSSGGIGVFLYALILFISAYYAINRSNNFLCKMLGLFLAFHWVIYFIEDVTKLDINYFFVWVAIGLCLSNTFRALNDEQVKQFFKFRKYSLIPMPPIGHSSRTSGGFSAQRSAS